MIDKQDMLMLARSVGVAVKEYVAAALLTMAARLDTLDSRIKAIPAGPQGEKGEKGEPGESIVGPAGPEGKPGEAIQGTPGMDGRPGKDAEAVDIAAIVAEAVKQIPVPKDGKDGMPGDSVDPERVRELVNGEVVKAVGALPRPKDGAPGKDAAPIHPDTVSLMVVTEVAKAIAAIPKAKDGRDGAVGRDALQIEILPMIDLTKSYPRGTYACHHGGLIRAVRNTDTMSGVIVGEIKTAGWEVVLNGIREVFVTQIDDRAFQVKHALTNGDRVVHDFSVPVLIYRDIYRAGEVYAKGDVVTWDGSAWYCVANLTKSGPAAIPSDWKLIVKRGRDSKPGVDGKPGPQGPQGPPGRDLTQLGPDGRKW